MRGSRRPLLAWLLLVLLPLQAWSATTMSVCGTAHAHLVLAVTVGGHGGASPHHAAHRTDAVAEPASASAAAPHARHAMDSALPRDGACSACAACLQGAVAPGADLAVAPARLRSPLFACAPELPVQHRIDVPERPPRSRLG